MWLFASSLAFASDPRFGIRLGYGASSVTKSGIIRSDSPGAFSFYFEYPFNSSVTISGEYKRSLNLSPFESAISFVELVTKYFFFVPMPQKMAKQEDAPKSFFVQRNISPYVGFGVGYAQSSFASKFDTILGDLWPESNAVGLGISAKVGAEYPMWNNIGLTSEFNYGMTILGNGSFSWMHIVFGTYFYF